MASYIRGWLGINGTAREGSILAPNQQWTLFNARVDHIDYAWTVTYLDGHKAVFATPSLYLDASMAGARVSLHESIAQGNGKTWQMDSTSVYIQNVNNAATGTLTTSGIFDNAHEVSFSAKNVRDADGLTHANFNYAWQTHNPDGSWSTIAGSGASLKLVNLAGSEVRPVMSFVDDWGTRETLVGEAHRVGQVNHAASAVLTSTGIDAYGNVAFNAYQVQDADGLTKARYTYSWQLHNADGSWSPLEGSTRSLSVTGLAGGQEVRPVLSFTDDLGNAETLTGNAVMVPTLPKVDLAPLDSTTVDRAPSPQTGAPFKLFDVGGQSIQSPSALVSLSVLFDHHVATLDVNWGNDTPVDFIRESSANGNQVTFKPGHATSAAANFFESILDHITITKHTLGSTSWLLPPTNFTVLVEDVNHQKNWAPYAHAVF